MITVEMWELTKYPPPQLEGHFPYTLLLYLPGDVAEFGGESIEECFCKAGKEYEVK